MKRSLSALSILGVATAASATPAPHCVATGADGTVLELLITEPLPGTSAAPQCIEVVDVVGIASTIGVPVRLDVFIVIDRSGSTRNSSFIDIDGDLVYDSILKVEIFAVRQVINAANPANVRFAILEFSSDATTEVPLTDDYAAVHAGLDRILADGPAGGTEFINAITELRAEFGRNGAPLTRTPITLFLSDGRDDAPITWIEAAAQGAAADGIQIDTFGIGSDADPIGLRTIADITGGDFYRMVRVGDILVVLPGVIAVGVDHIDILNRTTGDVIASQRTNLDGSFAIPLPVTIDRNEIEVVAVADNDLATEVVCATDFTVVCGPPPTFDSIPGDLDLECDGVLPDPPVLIATDACGADLPVAASEVFLPGRCPAAVTIRRSWSAEDDCLQESVATQTVRIDDTVAPRFVGLLPADTAVDCAAVPPAPRLTAIDNCAADQTVAAAESRLDGGCPDRYRLQRSWTAADSCGNLALHGQELQVDDLVAPLPLAALIPIPPAAPSSAAPAGSACSAPISRQFEVVCDASDDCDPGPLVEANLVVARSLVIDRRGGCMPVVERVAVACGEVVELRLQAPCASGRPRDGGPLVQTLPSGMRAITGDEVHLEVVATDRCGNRAVAVAPAGTAADWCSVEAPGGEPAGRAAAKAQLH